MYTHKVIIKRQRNDTPFFHQSIQSKSGYQFLIENFKRRGLLEREEFIESEDGLSLTRFLHFSDKESHDIALKELSGYRKMLKDYIQRNDQHIEFESYESPLDIL